VVACAAMCNDVLLSVAGSGVYQANSPWKEMFCRLLHVDLCNMRTGGQVNSCGQNEQPNSFLDEMTRRKVYPESG
jgi:hypothetical protein